MSDWNHYRTKPRYSEGLIQWKHSPSWIFKASCKLYRYTKKHCTELPSTLMVNGVCLAGSRHVIREKWRSFSVFSPNVVLESLHSFHIFFKGFSKEEIQIRRLLLCHSVSSIKVLKSYSMCPNSCCSVWDFFTNADLRCKGAAAHKLSREAPLSWDRCCGARRLPVCVCEGGRRGEREYEITTASFNAKISSYMY